MPGNNLWQGDDGSTPTTWSTNANWDTGTAPVDGDSVFLRNNSVSVLAGLNASSIQPAILDIASTYSGVIGGTSTTVNTLGSNYLQIGPLITYIGAPSTSGTAGAGSGRIKLDYGTDPNTTFVYSTKTTTSDTGFAPVRLKGTNTANKLYVLSGRVDCATEDPDDVYASAEFSVTGSDAVLSMSPACTWVTGYQTAGVVNLNSGSGTFSGATTFNQQAGTLNFKGTGMIRTLTVGGVATINARSTAMSVSGITRSSTTATATVASTATLATGDTVYIRGANQAGYNGFKTITVASGTTFTFTCASDDVTPATGTMTALQAIASLTITKSGKAYFGGDPREIAVAVLTYDPGAQWSFNKSNPSHLIIGTLTPRNAGQLTAA